MLNRVAIIADSGWGDEYSYHPECAAAAGVTGQSVNPVTLSESRRGCAHCGRDVSEDAGRPNEPMVQT